MADQEGGGSMSATPFLSKAQHTPGRWTAELYEWDERNSIAIMGPDCVIAVIPPTLDEPVNDEDWANARLLAASRDLLEACEALYKQAAKVDDSLSREVMERARAAISKAKGAQ